MALSFASHYKNSPNDLQLLSDAPAHHLFVLLPPVSEDQNTLPEPLVVLQVAMEGEISKGVVMEGLRRGRGGGAGGDMIPWVMSSQFNEPSFASLSGARVVRIATNPEFGGVSFFFLVATFSELRMGTDDLDDVDGVRSEGVAGTRCVL